MARRPADGGPRRSHGLILTRTKASEPVSAGKARTTAIAAAVIGLMIATAVVGYFNFGAILSAIRPSGVRGFLIVIVAQVALFVPLGLAWQL